DCSPRCHGTTSDLHTFPTRRSSDLREHYATLVQPGSVAALCTLGSHFETQTRQPGAELPGGESWRLGADPLQDAVGRVGADTPDTVDEDPGPTHIAFSAFEQCVH